MTDKTEEEAIAKELYDAEVSKQSIVHGPASRMKFLMIKSELVQDSDAVEELRKSAASDIKDKKGTMTNANGDESYPVNNAAQLKDAIRAVGRGGANHNNIRRHIMARAAKIGLSDKIPDNWASDGSLKTAVTKAQGDDMSEESIAEAKQIQKGLKMRSAGARRPEDLEAEIANLEAIAKSNSEKIAKADGDPVDGMTDDDDDTDLDAGGDVLVGDSTGGDATVPASPAWEQIDSDTATKWTAILSRVKVAVGVMADRESVEAASVNGDDDDDDNAMDLEDAQGALDFALDVLASYAVGEQTEADTEPVLKALAALKIDEVAASLGAVEGLQRIVKSEKATDAHKSTFSANQKALLHAVGSLPIRKADAVPQVLVYDANGNVVGTMDPANLVPIAEPKPAESSTDATAAEDATVPPAEAPAAPAAAAAPEAAPAAAADPTSGPVATNPPAAAPPAATDGEKTAVQKSEDDIFNEAVAVAVKKAMAPTEGELERVVKELESVKKLVETTPKPGGFRVGAMNDGSFQQIPGHYVSLRGQDGTNLPESLQAIQKALEVETDPEKRAEMQRQIVHEALKTGALPQGPGAIAR